MHQTLTENAFPTMRTYDYILELISGCKKKLFIFFLLLFPLGFIVNLALTNRRKKEGSFIIQVTFRNERTTNIFRMAELLATKFYFLVMIQNEQSYSFVNN